jgi:hypothetical protein
MYHPSIKEFIIKQPNPFLNSLIIEEGIRA